MFDDLNDGALGVSDALEALNELAGNTDPEILRQRASERIDVQVRVEIRPGNSSQRLQSVAHGMTSDLSDGGCRMLSSIPLMAGDMYWLTFDDAEFQIGALFARCLRCRMVQEEVFESGFAFLSTVDLQSAIQRDGS